MSPFPDWMADRWRSRPPLPQGQGHLYWHVLIGDQAHVRSLVRQAQRRLADFPGLDMTPLRWLHMTTLHAGTTGEILPAQTRTLVVQRA